MAHLERARAALWWGFIVLLLGDAARVFAFYVPWLALPATTALFFPLFMDKMKEKGPEFLQPRDRRPAIAIIACIGAYQGAWLGRAGAGAMSLMPDCLISFFSENLINLPIFYQNKTRVHREWGMGVFLVVTDFILFWILTYIQGGIAAYGYSFVLFMALNRLVGITVSWLLYWNYEEDTTRTRRQGEETVYREFYGFGYQICYNILYRLAFVQ